MKKTIITLLALAGVAASAESTIITFSTGGSQAGNYVYGVDFGDYSLNTHAVQSASQTTEDAVVTVTAETKLYTTYTVYADPENPGNDSHWTNAAALSDMNSTLGTSLTLANLDALPMATAGENSWDDATLTLNFSENYQAGDKFAIYLMLGFRDTNTSNDNYGVTLSGLQEGYTMEYASATGNGFGATGLTQTARQLTLVKITGRLTDAATVTVVGHEDSNNSFGMVAYKAIPEPATATLSLLALAGLAARRRRK